MTMGWTELVKNKTKGVVFTHMLNSNKAKRNMWNNKVFPDLSVRQVLELAQIFRSSVE